MASTVRRGRLIGAKVGAVVICITGWTMNQDAAKVKVTNSCSPGDGPEYIEGEGEDTGSFKGFVKSDFEINAIVEKGLEYAAELYYDKGAATNKYSGTIFIDSINTTGEIGGQYEYTVNFTVIGDLTKPTAT